MSSHEILTSWLELNINIDKYIEKRNKVEQELRNEISQLKNKIKEYEDGTEIQSFKNKIKEIEQERDMYYDLFMESPYRCHYCDKSITPETMIKKNSKNRRKR